MTRFLSAVTLALAVLAGNNVGGVYGGGKAKDKEKVTNPGNNKNSDDATDNKTSSNTPGYVRTGYNTGGYMPYANPATTGGTTGGTSSNTLPLTTGYIPSVYSLTVDDLEAITNQGVQGCYVELNDGTNFLLANGAPLGGLVTVDECRSPTNRCFCNTSFGGSSGIYCPVCVFEDAAPMLVAGWGQQCASAGRTVTYRTNADDASQGVAMKKCTCNADPVTGVASASCQPFESTHTQNGGVRGRHLMEQEQQEE